MTVQATDKKLPRPPFECIALLLQGGGALGAYQAGIYEALAEADLHPDWIAGISIGAINAAIIAGNPPGLRVENLRKFWEEVTTTPFWGQPMEAEAEMLKNGPARSMLNAASAYSAVMNGVAEFYAPRALTPWLQKPGSLDATSYYDTSKLKSTLERLVDFDRINQGTTRFCVGAVNVETGNFIYFDTATCKVGPQHIMASGALPPAFPAVEIDGEHYWDGGLVSNTPLRWMVDASPRLDTLAFQVDLWSAQGAFPHDMAEVMTRMKEIQYSSRTRDQTDRFRHMQQRRYAFANLFDKLPEELKTSPDARLLNATANHKVYNIVHLIYHARDYEGPSKDYEFSRPSMQDHWRSGYRDMARTLEHREILQRPTDSGGIGIFDFSREKKPQAAASQQARKQDKK